MLIQKSVIVLSILGGSMAFAQNIVHQPVNPNGVTPGSHLARSHQHPCNCPKRSLALQREAMRCRSNGTITVSSSSL